MIKVVAVVGPTAVGKTRLGIELAQRFDGEIISGDSMQVYRHLNIGTAKATPAEQQQAKHHLIDRQPVTEQYTAAMFVTAAQSVIEDLQTRHRLPIIVGGTGFYLKALLEGLHLGAESPRALAVRSHLQQLADEQGPQVLWQRLNQLDPEAAAKIPPQNQRRLIRALEVITVSGQLFSRQADMAPGYDALIIGLNTARPVLYQRINQRVDWMMSAGLLTEAKWLYEQGGSTLPASHGIGYSELMPYFAGDRSLDTAVDLIKRDSRRYAKRQLTWFRHQTTAHWFDLIAQPQTQGAIDGLVANWLK